MGPVIIENKKENKTPIWHSLPLGRKSENQKLFIFLFFIYGSKAHPPDKFYIFMLSKNKKGLAKNDTKHTLLCGVCPKGYLWHFMGYI